MRPGRKEQSLSGEQASSAEGKASVTGRSLAGGQPRVVREVTRARTVGLGSWDRALLALLLGTALSGWVITALQVSASANRPLTRMQARAWARARSEIGSCFLRSDAAHRPFCETRNFVSGPTKARDLVLLGLVTPLVVLVSLLGLVMPMLAALVFAATKDRDAARRRAAILWFFGFAATALVAWIGVAPESSLALLAGQAACLLTIGASLMPRLGIAQADRLKTGAAIRRLETEA